MPCSRARFLRIQSARRPEFTQRQRLWAEKNAEHCAAYFRDHYEKNKDRRNKDAAKWAAANPEKRKQIRAKWKRANAPAVAADRAIRRAAQRKATPRWLDRASLKPIYEKRKAVSDQTGIPHHVDHVVPLIHKSVCGLHVPWNLQIIPAQQNYSKNNRFDVEADHAASNR